MKFAFIVIGSIFLQSQSVSDRVYTLAITYTCTKIMYGFLPSKKRMNKKKTWRQFYFFNKSHEIFEFFNKSHEIFELRSLTMDELHYFVRPFIKVHSRFEVVHNRLVSDKNSVSVLETETNTVRSRFKKA